MNEFAILAFVVTPALVVALAYIGMRLHGREGRRLAQRLAAEKGERH